MIHRTPSGGSSAPITCILSLALAPLASAQWSQPGTGAIANGGAITYGDVDRDGRLDVVLASTEDSAQGQRFVHAVQKSVDGSGRPTGASSSFAFNGAFSFTAGQNESGVGIALADLDNNGALELIIGMVYPKAATHDFEWRIGWNLQNDGAVSSWGPTRVVPMGDVRSQGAGLAVGDFQSNGRPDLVLAYYENPTTSPANVYRYKILLDLNTTGVPGSETAWLSTPGQGHDAEGADVAVTNLDADPAPELILACNDAPSGPNEIRWKVGWNMTPSGGTLQWTERAPEPTGSTGLGAGIYVGRFDADPRPDIVFCTLEPDAFSGFSWEVRPGRNGLGATLASGPGCPLGSIQPALSLPDCELPTDCRPLSIRANVPFYSAGILFFDVAPGAPPLDLGPFGFPGCTLFMDLFDPQAPFTGALPPKVDFPALCGFDRLYVQGAFLSLPPNIDLGLTPLVELLFGRY